MADEAVLVLEIAPPVPFTCADGAGIEKGATLKMSDPRTAAQASTLNDIPAGIAASEKIASDGNTTIPVYRQGWFKVLISGSVTVGDALIHTTGTNDFTTATVNAENVWGIALETGTDNEYILMELKPMVMNLA